MAFIDDLALVEVLLLLAGAILAYGGAVSYWAIRKNDPKGLRSALRGMAIPVGGVGAVTMTVAIWGEMTWPFPAAFSMAGYNIFFFDALALFGLVLLAYAASAFLGARLQYVGVLALVSGGVLAFYGYTAYGAAKPFTTEPLDTYLLYLGFAGAGIMAFPATVIVDYYLAATETLRHPFTSAKAVAMGGLRQLGVRGAQAIAPTRPEAPDESAVPATPLRYHVPYWTQGLLLLFPIVMAVAAFAALWYFGVTLPHHLSGGPGAAP